MFDRKLGFHRAEKKRKTRVVASKSNGLEIAPPVILIGGGNPTKFADLLRL